MLGPAPSVAPMTTTPSTPDHTCYAAIFTGHPRRAAELECPRCQAIAAQLADQDAAATAATSYAEACRAEHTSPARAADIEAGDLVTIPGLTATDAPLLVEQATTRYLGRGMPTYTELTLWRHQPGEKHAIDMVSITIDPDAYLARHPYRA